MNANKTMLAVNADAGVSYHKTFANVLHRPLQSLTVACVILTPIVLVHVSVTVTVFHQT